MAPLDRFLSVAAEAIAARAAGPAVPAAARLATRLAATPEVSSRAAPGRHAACTHLEAAMATTPATLRDAFASLAPDLAWRGRDGLGDEYAGAPLLGPAGLQQRGGLVAGISLLAPGATYPDHDHPPEEIYLALSGGEWWNAETPWHAPGPGGIVHNPPGILHAMRGTAVPLLAVWFLLPAPG